MKASAKSSAAAPAGRLQLAWTSRKRLAQVLGGLAALGLLLRVGLSSPDEAGAVPAPAAQELPPSQFVIVETSWGSAPAAPSQAAPAEGERSPGDVWVDEERQRRFEEARERWENLDIAVRRS